MSTLKSGSTVTVVRRGEAVELQLDGSDVGRVRGERIELLDLDVRLVPLGERWGLVDDRGATVARLDRAGDKATWMAFSDGRFRLARQRPIPLLRRWSLTRGVTSNSVLDVMQTPLGTRVVVRDDTGVDQQQLAALVVGALVETLGLTTDVPTPA